MIENRKLNLLYHSVHKWGADLVAQLGLAGTGLPHHLRDLRGADPAAEQPVQRPAACTVVHRPLRPQATQWTHPPYYS